MGRTWQEKKRIEEKMNKKMEVTDQYKIEQTKEYGRIGGKEDSHSGQESSRKRADIRVELEIVKLPFSTLPP